MTTPTNIDLYYQTVWLRSAQLCVNHLLQQKYFKVPIHLALGHEAIAIAVDHSLKKGDSLFLTHRNIHYNLARSKAIQAHIDEYILADTGTCKGSMGSMNLSSPNNQIPYTSSILGNNLPVAVGSALGDQFLSNGSLTIVATGDGAIEEGAFYESLLFATTHNLPIIYIVENNNWSLATSISSRRYPINLAQLAHSVGACYTSLSSNDVTDYVHSLVSLREKAISSCQPIILEVGLTTLGYWYVKDDNKSEPRFINYHGGASPITNSAYDPLIQQDYEDPLFLIKQTLGDSQFEILCKQVASDLQDTYR